MKREAEWVVPLSERAQKRHWHAIERGKVVAFAVQLEVWMSGNWQPVVRYDAAHGFTHRDVYQSKTRKRKEELGLGLDEALTLADEDLDENWERYLTTFLRRFGE